MEQELSKLRDSTNKQLAQLKQEKSQQRDQIETLTNRVKALTSDPMQPKLEAEIEQHK